MDYLLPDDGLNKNYVLAREDYYFVYPTRFREYERQFRGSFQHGGVSIEEMLLPFVTEDLARLPDHLHLFLGVPVVLEGIDVRQHVEGDLPGIDLRLDRPSYNFV